MRSPRVEPSTTEEENLMSRDIKKRWLRMLAFAALVTASVILRPAHSRGSELTLGEERNVAACNGDLYNSDAAPAAGLHF